MKISTTVDQKLYVNMLLRTRNGRRFHICLKYLASLLVAIVYFTFLFRESLNAFEQNKDKIGSLPLVSELKRAPRLQYHHYRQHQHQQKQQNQNQNENPTVSITAPTTINPIYEYSEELHSATEKDLKERNAHLNAICRRHNLQSSYPPNPWEFFISPGHNLVWCNVFKAASSVWMYYFNILGGYDLKFLQRTEIPPIELARKRFPRPSLYELLENLSNSVSFLFVRDPLERVLSAYRNKFESGKNLYFKPLGKKIIRRFRKVSSPNGIGNYRRSAPTFEEFVHYLIEQNRQNKSFDEHWAPVYRFCTPCSVNFTIIGKVESFQRDTEYIIRQAGLESLLLGKLPKHKIRKIGNLSSDIKSNELLEKYFSTLDRKTLDELLNIYRLDFELFNYDYNKYYSIVSGTTITHGSYEMTTNTVTAKSNIVRIVMAAINSTTPK